MMIIKSDFPARWIENLFPGSRVCLTNWPWNEPVSQVTDHFIWKYGLEGIWVLDGKGVWIFHAVKLS